VTYSKKRIVLKVCNLRRANGYFCLTAQRRRWYFQIERENRFAQQSGNLGNIAKIKAVVGIREILRNVARWGKKAIK